MVVTHLNRRQVGEPYINTSGYIYIKVENLDTGRKYNVPQHRFIWEEANGKKIPKGYVIHHKDGNKKNNTVGNLQLMTRAAHKKLHKQYRNIKKARRLLARKKKLDARSNNGFYRWPKRR